MSATSFRGQQSPIRDFALARSLLICGLESWKGRSEFGGGSVVIIDSLRRRVERSLRSRLVWNNAYRTTSYLRSSLWVVPIVAIVVVMIVVPVLRVLDGWLGWRFSGLTTAGAQSLFQSVITLTLSFIVFAFGSLLVAIQVASGQLTPRIIATTLLRNNVVRYSVGLFVFTLVLGIMGLNRLERVNDMVAMLTGLLGIASIAAFLFLIDYAARLLRPVSIVAHVCNEGLAVIQAVYPRSVADGPDDQGAAPIAPGAPQRTVRHHGRSEHILAVDLPSLVREARRADGLIELVPEVGDFVASGQPLFVLYDGAVEISDRQLQIAVAFGTERTMEQDPLFSFRIMVDIALKALSPAINDPTTAVLAIDQIHRLLRVVGERQLRGETIADSRGRARVIVRTPNWEDFVHVACQEIRMCGAGNVQIARRLRAMLDDLRSTLPAHRHQILDDEARRLTQALQALYPQPDDLELAMQPDRQGLGGSIRPARTAERP